MERFGPAYSELRDGARAITQVEVIRDVLFSAEECRPRDGGWMTLRELGDLTTYGEASISAQLRHLRKRRFGGYVIEKRRRGAPGSGVWEYRIAGRTERAERSAQCAARPMTPASG
jgi:hypothetical protein